MNRFAVAMMIASMLLTPVSARAQEPVYASQIYPDNGGWVGLTLDGPYDWQGLKVIKVLTVHPRSNLNGSIFPGDYIYGINGFNIRSVDDYINIVRSGGPGANVTIYFLDSRRNFATMQVTIALISAVNLAPPSTQPAQTAQSPSFCNEHPFICAAGLVLGVAAVASAVKGSASGPSVDNGQNNSSGPQIVCTPIYVEGVYKGQDCHE